MQRFWGVLAVLGVNSFPEMAIWLHLVIILIINIFHKLSGNE